MADVKALAEELVNLSVKDVRELAKVLKEEYGIEPAAAAVAVAGQLQPLTRLRQSRLSLTLSSSQPAQLNFSDQSR